MVINQKLSFFQSGFQAIACRSATIAARAIPTPFAKDLSRSGARKQQVRPTNSVRPFLMPVDFFEMPRFKRP
ncbi:hypothetical protein [Novosphingobium pentaromativorans]|uniref:Uncharacterized protein n=1 Tax=Novosphingobium pentaromativorans US6-1 TaxID=1088721 RepID=G6E8M5_9SPHN|nr:hypothetical protein [Novosphingobium pentaromativorans]EHJ62099.1 hypothetical protein NSU_0696 [Novosphingobium pentaromativorans US6-1]